MLEADAAEVAGDDAVAQEWLLVRRTSQGKCSYTLSNAPPDTPLIAASPA